MPHNDIERILYNLTQDITENDFDRIIRRLRGSDEVTLLEDMTSVITLKFYQDPTYSFTLGKVSFLMESIRYSI
jgi:hypothetical protein